MAESYRSSRRGTEEITTQNMKKMSDPLNGKLINNHQCTDMNVEGVSRRLVHCKNMEEFMTNKKPFRCSYEG